jgi:hypothetical protein
MDVYFNKINMSDGYSYNGGHYYHDNDHYKPQNGKIKIYTDSHPCGIYVSESKARYALTRGLVSKEIISPKDTYGENSHESHRSKKHRHREYEPVKKLYECEPVKKLYECEPVKKRCECESNKKPCDLVKKRCECESKKKHCGKPDPCSVVAECDLNFKIFTSYSGSTVTSGDIVPATPNNYLTLCCDTAKLKVNLSDDFTRIILGVPMLHTRDCYVYSLVPPDIADESLSTTTYTENLEVKDLVTGSVLGVGMQVLNGYLYIEIDIEGKVIKDECECLGTVYLCFSTFKFLLTPKVNCCEVDCKPITWNCTAPINEII